MEPASLLPVAGVVLGVVLKWAFDALTERGKQKRENQLRGWDTRREAYALLRHRGEDAFRAYVMWADGTATNLDPVEIKERQDRYLEMLLAMHEQFRTIELLAPKRVMETAYYLVHSLPDIWSHEEIPAPMPDYALAADAFMAAARADLGAVD